MRKVITTNLHCAVCRKELVEGEDGICVYCYMSMPRTHAAEPQNALWSRLCGQVSFEHATALFYYQRNSPFSRAVASAKYDDRPWCNEVLTDLLVKELDGSGWPFDIDVIVPVPLHLLRLIGRGYNQVQPIANTLGKRWHLPVVRNVLIKKKYVRSQVGRGQNERTEAERGAFATLFGSRLKGKHVLLVDDVCTTGSTLVSCADELLKIPGTRVSVLTLAVTI
ncbi:MAG: ComF family protein [Bacteroidales bacterium]|nr:ComF family protein [Candidatus Liminaster caballi]